MFEGFFKISLSFPSKRQDFIQKVSCLLLPKHLYSEKAPRTQQVRLSLKDPQPRVQARGGDTTSRMVAGLRQLEGAWSELDGPLPHLQTKLVAEGVRTSFGTTVSRTGSLSWLGVQLSEQVSWGPCSAPGEPRAPNKLAISLHPQQATPDRLTRRWLCPMASSGLAGQGWASAPEPWLNLKRAREWGRAGGREGCRRNGPRAHGPHLPPD